MNTPQVFAFGLAIHFSIYLIYFRMIDRKKYNRNRGKFVEREELVVRSFVELKSPSVIPDVNPRLLARNLSTFTLQQPVRETIRDENYRRRKLQRTLQGYKTPSHKV